MFNKLYLSFLLDQIHLLRISEQILCHGVNPEELGHLDKVCRRRDRPGSRVSVRVVLCVDALSEEQGRVLVLFAAEPKKEHVLSVKRLIIRIGLSSQLDFV